MYVGFNDRVPVSNMTLNAELQGNMSVGSRVIIEHEYVKRPKGTDTEY
jgi:hypothetical protein